MNSFILIIDGTIFSAENYREKIDTEFDTQIVLGLFGLEPGQIQTQITYREYYIDTNASLYNLIGQRKHFLLIAEDNMRQIIDGYINKISSTGGFDTLHIKTMPTQKTRFVPEIGEPTEWKEG